MLYNGILPLLENLKKNPEKDYIYWPNRTGKVEEFELYLKKIYQGEQYVRRSVAQIRTLQRRQRSVWNLNEQKDEAKTKVYNEVTNDRDKNRTSETVAHRSESD